MATAIFFPFSLDLQQNPSKTILLKTHHPYKSSQPFTFPISKPSFHSPIHKFHPLNCTPTISSSNSYRTGRFLSIPELEKLQILENFRYFHEFELGSLSIRMMKQEEMDFTVGLLAESFGESMKLPFDNYVNLLAYLVKQYLIDRRVLMPHTATLVGYYREGDGEEKEELAGTVEISFNKRGANSAPPTPTPPKDSPYICNMTVKKNYRRRGIGWHLLKACEELISQMSISRDVYLHCRMIDEAPFNMYTKAGYSIVKTDNYLILLTLQRRKHLMCKTLPVTENKESNIDNTPLLGISNIVNILESNSKPEPYVSSFDDSIVPENSSDIPKFEKNLSFSGTSESDIPVGGDSNSS